MLARRPESVQLVDLFGIATLQLQVPAMQKQKLRRLDVKFFHKRELPVEDRAVCTKQLAVAGCRLCRAADVEKTVFQGWSLTAQHGRLHDPRLRKRKQRS